MKLFYSESNEIEVFIKLWEKCPTACNSCSFANAKEQFYDYKIINKLIDSAVLLTWDNIRFFLYWTDTLMHPELENILDHVYLRGRVAMIQLDYYSIENKMDLLNSLKMNYPQIEFLIARMIKNKDDFSNLLLSFKNHTKLYPTIHFRYDIIIDTYKYPKAFEIMLRKMKGVVESNMHDNYSFTFGSVSWCLSKAITINPKEKKVDNVSFKGCVLDKFYNVGTDRVDLFDSIEIDNDGNFRIHTPLCFLWDLKISNISFSNKKIINDFRDFKKFLRGRDYSDMWKACYKCIKTPYSFK